MSTLRLLVVLTLSAACLPASGASPRQVVFKGFDAKLAQAQDEIAEWQRQKRAQREFREAWDRAQHEHNSPERIELRQLEQRIEELESQFYGNPTIRRLMRRGIR